MTKIGQLVLAGGSWKGRQIVSKEWIETSTAPKIQAVTDGFNGLYGYLWWLARYRINGREVDCWPRRVEVASTFGSSGTSDSSSP